MTTVGVGDVLAVRTSGVGAWFIRAGAALRGLPHSTNHVVVAHHLDNQGRWIGLEGRPGGVGWVDMTDYVKSPATVDNGEQPKTEAQRYLVAKAAERLIGCAYDWAAIGGDALNDLGFVLGTYGGWGKQAPLHVVCSSFAAWCYEQVGLPRPSGGRLVQPADWARFDAAKGWLS